MYGPKVLHPQRGYIRFDPYPYQTDLFDILDAGGPAVV
jgi:hypothetical protein